MIINRKRLNDSDSFPEHKGCWGLFFLGEFIVIQKNQKSHNSEAFNNSVLFIQFGDPEIEAAGNIVDRKASGKTSWTKTHI